MGYFLKRTNIVGIARKGKIKIKEIELLIEKLESTQGKERIIKLIKIAKLLKVNNISKAEFYVKEAIELASKLNFKAELADSYQLYGKIYFLKSMYESSLNYFFKALLIYKEVDDLKNIGHLYCLIGDILSSLEKYTDAVEYYEKSIEILKKQDQKEKISAPLSGLAIIYKFQKNYKKSLEYNFKILEILNNEDKLNIIGINNNIATNYKYMKDYKKSLEFYFKALDLSKDLKNINIIVIIKLNIGIIYWKLKDFKKAFEFINKSMYQAEKLNLDRQLIRCYLTLSEIYEEDKNYKDALKFSKKYIDLSENINKSEKENQIVNLKKQFENEKIEREAEIIKIKNIELTKKNKIINETNIELKELVEQHKELIKERDEFIEIIAHDLRNPLTIILYSADYINSFYKELKYVDILKHSETIVNTASRMDEIVNKLLEMSRIEDGNIKIEKKDYSLNSIINRTIQDFQSVAEKKNISFIYHDNKKDIKIYTDNTIFYEILENLISNAIKFSTYGKYIYIIVSESIEKIIIEIKDQGLGFNEEDMKKIFTKFAKLSSKPTAGESSTGLGLSIVKKLINKINASIECKSDGKDKGSSFIIELSKTIE